MRQGNRKKTVRRFAGFALLAALTLRAVGATAAAGDFSAAVQTLRQEAELPVALLRFTLGDFWEDDGLSVQTALALHYAPLLAQERAAVVEAWSSELQLPPDTQQDTEDAEGTTLSQPPDESERQEIADNGVPARTLRVSDASGYDRIGSIYINNASSCAIHEADFTEAFAAQFHEDSPQVLILHTHGTEAYTMPAGEEYLPSDEYRTLEAEKNMLRIGDEIASVLTAAGFGVVHDRELYDYPNYSGAYNRSLAAIERAKEMYPTLLYVLDIHRDAVTDAEGNSYKLLCAERSDAAQMEFVIGTNGGGAAHERWRENLKLACAVQENIAKDYPTLMRPIILRNSRYNQHMTTGSLLLEVGTAGNSLDEALAAARLFAEGFVKTVKEANA